MTWCVEITARKLFSQDISLSALALADYQGWGCSEQLAQFLGTFGHLSVKPVDCGKMLPTAFSVFQASICQLEMTGKSTR